MLTASPEEMVTIKLPWPVQSEWTDTGSSHIKVVSLSPKLGSYMKIASMSTKLSSRIFSTCYYKDTI